MQTRRITGRLYPNRHQESKLFEWRRLHCYLYNAALSNRKTQYQQLGHSVSYFEQQNSLPEFKEVWPKFKELGSHALQATLKRVDFAYQRFFKGLAKYPKFKSIRHYSGWTYPCPSGWKAETDGKNGYLKLSNLGRIQMRGQARTWGNPTTCTIVYPQDKWYASITVACEPKRELGSGIVGMDLGCKVAIALSTGEIIKAPQFLIQAQPKIRHLAKKLRRKRQPEKRKVKADRRWLATQKRIRKQKRKVANQRQNWVHQPATEITCRHSIVATEKLNLQGMTRKGKRQNKQKAGLNRSILDVGMGMRRSALKYKLVEGEGFFMEAPTQKLKPTQRCAKCWQLTPKTLSDRIHVCSNPECGHREDRDINAAQVCEIWARGQELTSLDVEPSSATDCGSMRQLGARKRQKSRASEVVHVVESGHRERNP
ncbi:transposase [Phormidium pseudopriestleyi FRX01]|uniref:Transposase n=1 Tax=Phormidium pseudopriestleyi FRX01 TaxID=1759528 RepID=A0ABS3FYP9_9CYAN|nr:RNA-guided endonuclease TnpB family protein [Phormidium pseudopriestleyi]MBO0352267.1 transposase [Phormidium pseudopriestleyi FRX01]